MATKQVKKSKIKKQQPPKTFEQRLNQLRRDIFEAAFDPDICGMATINELAVRAGLCWATVERLYRNHDHTKNPGLKTIYGLARAVKMDIGLVKEGLQV